mgnify:FL=1
MLAPPPVPTPTALAAAAAAASSSAPLPPSVAATVASTNAQLAALEEQQAQQLAQINLQRDALLAQQAQAQAQAQANMDAAVVHAQEQQAPLVVDSDELNDDTDAPMLHYLDLVNSRPMEETKHNSVCTDKWMIKLLEQNGWWLRSEHALFVCKELGITQPAERFYYRSIYIWLPDIRYGIDSMPSCPNGCCSSNVSSHGFCSGDISNIARRVTGITTHYYVISKRYKCKSCEKTKGTDTPLYFSISLISTFLAQGVEISAQPQLFWSRRSSKESFSPLSLFLPPSFLPPSPFLPLFPPSSLSSANLICRHRNRKKPEF